jgi:lipopolysaccharide transport system permease protein
MNTSLHTIIKPREGLSPVNFQEIRRYKDLLYFMVLRDITVLYKQSIFGIGWVIVAPLFSVVLFTIIFGRLAGVPSDGMPYPLFALCGILPWTYFSTSLTAASNSLILNANIFTKVYFPRLILPFTPVLSKLLDFGIGFIFLLIVMLYYKYAFSIKLFAFPLLIVIMIMTTSGLGFWLSSLALQYRDIKFALTFMIPMMMYAAPVVFPASLVLNKFGYTTYLLYGLYPMTGIIEGLRSIVAVDKPIAWDMIAMSAGGGLLMLIIGTRIFKKLEAKFADVA